MLSVSPSPQGSLACADHDVSGQQWRTDAVSGVSANGEAQADTVLKPCLHILYLTCPIHLLVVVLCRRSYTVSSWEQVLVPQRPWQVSRLHPQW
jgi:hypothetical protein